MMFKRTGSGILNYSKFFGSDLLVVTEGKVCEDSDLSVPDVKFYKYLFELLVPGVTIKIKCVGNSSAALAYLDSLVADSRGVVVIVDRDFDGVLFSRLNNNNLIQTFGYSWETDFWGFKVVKSVLNGMLGSLRFDDSELEKKVRNCISRLRVLAAMDASIQVSGKTLFPKKRGACLGMQVSVSSDWIVSHGEGKRLIKNYRAVRDNGCCVERSALELAKNIQGNRLINGHLWEGVLVRYASEFYKKISKDCLPSKSLIQNIALEKIRELGFSILNDEVVGHYRSEISRCGLADRQKSSQF